jgi:beta-glucosidase
MPNDNLVMVVPIAKKLELYFNRWMSELMPISTFLQPASAPTSALPNRNALDQLGRDFVWGVATAAFQIEGANRSDGRGESIWDRFCATPGKVRNGDDGSVACDHYHRWPEDVALMRQLGVDAYRFSIAWPRVQADGEGAWNAPGEAFYDRLIDGLLAAGIQPHATLYHWDLPQALQDKGGWTTRSTAQRFAEYAERMGRLFGDRLTTLSTHNEPWCTAVMGHETGQFAPGWRDEQAAVQVGHHLLLSHGWAMQAMRAAGVRCPLGIVLNQSSRTAATPKDQPRADLDYAKFVRRFMDPLLLGRYPQIEGFIQPAIAEGDLAAIRQPLDFLGINYYTRMWVSQDGLPPPAVLGRTDMGWEIYPAGLRELLVGLQREYRLPPIYIMENGMANADEKVDGAVNDVPRIDYLRRHLEALADAKAEGVDVRGYFAWSLMDNFEWDSGYAKRFGLVHVDYTTLKRTPKASYDWYRRVAEATRQGAGRA